MGKSYRKPYGSWIRLRSMKAWRTQENRRLRHNAKILINNCEDYDNLVIPVLNEYGTLWSSPRDGRQFLWEAPLLNQCEVDLEEAILRVYRWYGDRRTQAELEKYVQQEVARYVHGGRNCQCYSNKRNSYYWRLSRK